MGRPGRGCGELVKILPAVLCAAQTMDLLVLDGELVVVGDFFAKRDRLLGVDDDLLLAVDGDDFGVAVRLQRQKDNGLNIS